VIDTFSAAWDLEIHFPNIFSQVPRHFEKLFHEPHNTGLIITTFDLSKIRRKEEKKGYKNII